MNTFGRICTPSGILRFREWHHLRLWVLMWYFLYILYNVVQFTTQTLRRSSNYAIHTLSSFMSQLTDISLRVTEADPSRPRIRYKLLSPYAWILFINSCPKPRPGFRLLYGLCIQTYCYLFNYTRLPYIHRDRYVCTMTPITYLTSTALTYCV